MTKQNDIFFKQMARSPNAPSEAELADYVANLAHDLKAHSISGPMDVVSVLHDELPKRLQQLSLYYLSETDSELPKDTLKEAATIVGIIDKANSPGSIPAIAQKLKDMDSHTVEQIIDQIKFTTNDMKEKFLNAVDINMYNSNRTPTAPTLFRELIDGALTHANTPSARSSLPSKMALEIEVINSTFNEITSSADRGDLKSFGESMSKVSEESQKHFIELLLTSNDKRQNVVSDYLDSLEATAQNTEQEHVFKKGTLISELTKTLTDLDSDTSPLAPDVH